MTVTALGAVRRSAASEPDVAAIYAGTVEHRRFGPAARAFTPKLFLAYLDVDALPGSLDAIPTWSARRPALVQFRRADFFDGGTAPLGDAVRDLVRERLGRRPQGSITLLAHLRTFGWLFNPVAVYYCWAADGDELDAVVLEVTNTPWGERHWYVFDARGGVTTGQATKDLYVSPFLPMELEYRITWTEPGEALRLRVEAERGGVKFFEADLALRRVRLDRSHAIEALVRYPLMTMRVSAAIYREAIRLLSRRLRVHRHHAGPAGGCPR
jgi:DUF1365 family protein